MKLPIKQVEYFLMVPHKNTVESAILWWMLRKNKHCHSFCPTCKYYFRCQEDVAIETYKRR